MVLAEATGQKLGAQHMCMIQNGENFCLMMHMIARSNLMAACDDSQCLILNWLQTPLNEARLDDGTPDARSIGIRRSDKGLKGVGQDFEVFSPFRTCNSF